MRAVTSTAGLAFLLLTANPSQPRAEREQRAISAIHIVSGIDGALPSSDHKRARKGQVVTLHAVLEVGAGSAKRFYSSVPAFRLSGRRHQAQPLSLAPFHFVYWHKVEPAAESMSNTASGKFRFETIEYVESLLMHGFGIAGIDADVRPLRTVDRGDGVGTMRFKVSAIGADGAVVSSPSIESRGPRGSGGLAATVHRVTIRRDDSYLGFLTELYGQPYIWASAGRTDRSHQSERLEGSDCADFVVYGHRRMGAKVPYTWTGGLPKFTRKLSRGEVGADGTYRDAAGEPIPFPKVGDLVLFPRHVGVLTQDRGAIGVLDGDDIMMHSYFASPREQAIKDSDYANTWLEVRRWK